MRRFLLISSGILFILASSALVVIGAVEDEFFIITASMAIPFLFTGFWNFYSIVYEKRINYSNEFFISGATFSAAIGVFYHKDIAVPVFLILFISSSLAIITAFLSLNKETAEIAFGLPPLSLLICIYITVKYQKKLSLK